MFCLFGCDVDKNYYDKINKEIDKTTVSQTYFLRTVVHDEHLFIVSNGGILHHPDCPCCKSNKTEKETPLPPIIIDFNNKL